MNGAATNAGQTEEIRRFGRRRVMLAAKLHSVHGECAAVLLDLSEGGAMISVSPTLPVGCKLLLVRHSFEAAAVVAWAAGNRLGLKFDEPLEEAIVEYLVSRPDPTNAH